MRWFITPKRAIDVNISKYRIDWDKPAASKEATKVKVFLKEYWKNHVVLEEFRLPRCLLRADFLNLTLKVAIEHNGKGAHDAYNKHFHKGSRLNFLASLKRDVKKQELLEMNGFQFIVTETRDLPYLSRDFFIEKFGLYL